MRAARSEPGKRWCNGSPDRLLVFVAAVALVVAAAGGGVAAGEESEGVVVRVYAVQASGLSTYDCSVQIEVHNQMGTALKGFAATLDFLDAQGAVIAHKPFEMTRIRPTARRREGLGFKLAPEVDRQVPRDMAELIDQCKVLASAAIRLRACESDRGSIFAECQAGLAAHVSSELPLAIRRDAVAEWVNYGVVAPSQGHRADIAEQTIIDRLGLTVSTISDDLAWENGLSPVVQGLLVVATAPGGPAEAAGVRTGDVIAEIDQDTALASEEATVALDRLTTEGRRSLLLLLDRNGDAVFTVVRVSP